MDILLVRTDDPQTADLREQYYALRTESYRALYGPGHYPHGPDRFDAQRDTQFCLMVEDGKVIAGARILTHLPGTDTQMHCESGSGSCNIADLLPHLDMHAMRYIEVGGTAVDLSPAYKDRHLGTDLQRYIFDKIKDGTIATQLIVGAAAPRNVTPSLRAGEESGLSSVVREDAWTNFNDLPPNCVMVMLSPNPDFPFLSKSMKATGIGTPSDVFIAKQRAEKAESRNEKSV